MITNMNSPVYKLLTRLVLPLVIIGLVYLIVDGILEPVQFNREMAAREKVAIQRLKDIRTIENAFKEEFGHYASTADSLKDFYNNGKMTIEMQIGSQDDSVAVANTKALKRRNPRITPAQMLTMSMAGENLVFSIKNAVPVKDTLFVSRPEFCIDSIFIVPFCGDSISLQTTIKQVSGVAVPLFEASMTYKQLLKGMDNQLRINLDADREAQGNFKGLMVGSISAPNNNAGNWE